MLTERHVDMFIEIHIFHGIYISPYFTFCPLQSISSEEKVHDVAYPTRKRQLSIYN
jgi:hypothetical protein